MKLPCFLRRTSSTSSWLPALRAQRLQHLSGGIPGECCCRLPVHSTNSFQSNIINNLNGCKSHMFGLSRLCWHLTISDSLTWGSLLWQSAATSLTCATKTAVRASTTVTPGFACACMTSALTLRRVWGLFRKCKVRYLTSPSSCLCIATSCQSRKNK